MPFTPIADKAPRQDFKKQEFITLGQGQHLIRVLDEDYLEVQTHFVNKSSIKCLGADCPICKNNRIIIQENPETFKDVKGYLPRASRFFINVLDRTNVKICPKCGEEIKAVGLPACPECNQSIISTPVTPLNKIKILAKGKTLFEQLVQLENAILDDSGSRIGLTNFDIQLMVMGSGKTTTTTPIYTGKPGTPPEYKAEDKFDLEKAVITLTPEEITDFLRGIGLKDIYTARRLGKDQKDATPNTQLPASLEDAANAAMNLFGIK